VTEEVIVYVTGDSAYCKGEDNSHPKVYYFVPKEGFAICGYCGIKFIRRESNEQ
jgi:uncharacterized Zn-finger protein